MHFYIIVNILLRILLLTHKKMEKKKQNEKIDYVL